MGCLCIDSIEALPKMRLDACEWLHEAAASASVDGAFVDDSARVETAPVASTYEDVLIQISYLNTKFSKET